MADLNDIFRGDSKSFKVTFKDKYKQPIPLFGSELWMTAKVEDTDPDEDAVWQRRHVFPDNDESLAGIGYITLSPSDTDVEAGIYQYDFQRVVPGSPPDVKTLAKGQIRVVQDVTQSNA